jgi:hypothetical protein
MSPREVAQLVASPASSVMRGRNRWQRGGNGGMRVRSGVPNQAHSRPTQAHVYATDEWTAARIAQLMERRFHVDY